MSEDSFATSDFVSEDMEREIDKGSIYSSVEDAYTTTIDGFDSLNMIILRDSLIAAYVFYSKTIPIEELSMTDLYYSKGEVEKEFIEFLAYLHRISDSKDIVERHSRFKKLLGEFENVVKEKCY